MREGLACYHVRIDDPSAILAVMTCQSLRFTGPGWPVGGPGSADARRWSPSLHSPVLFHVRPALVPALVVGAAFVVAVCYRLDRTADAPRAARQAVQNSPTVP